MVMSVSPVRNAFQARKYFEQDNYYREGDSQETAWGGRLAEEFGIAGQAVDADLFLQLLQGQLPGGEEIKRGVEGRHKPATDLTFNVPKSVSIAAFEGGDPRIIDANRRAVAATMAYAERELAGCRTTRQGNTGFEKTGQLLYAQFTHDTSRLEEAHLHSHVLVLNVTRDADGKFKALENHPLYKHQMLLGAVYHAELRREMEVLGYSTRDKENARNGEFEINEVDPEHARRKSSRRRQIEAYLHAKGIDSERASQRQLDIATKATRQKKREIDHAALHRRSQQEFRERYPEWKRPEPTPAQQARTLQDQQARAGKALDAAFEHHLEKNSVVKAPELLHRALIEGNGIALAEIEGEIARRTKAGRVIAGSDGRLTTQEARAREQRMLEVVDRGRAVMPPIVSPNRAEALLGPMAAQTPETMAGAAASDSAADHRPPPGRSRHPTLNDESPGLLTGKLNEGQQHAARLMLTGTDRINVIQGVAGAGKTHMLDTVRSELERNGYHFIGIAPSHQAKDEMRKVMGEGATLQSFLVDPREQRKLNAHSVVVLDEAGMASTQQMHDLTQIVEKSGARLFLVGDDRQFKAVEAGNPFRQIQGHGAAMAEMAESVRQKDDRLKAVVGTMNAGQVGKGLQQLEIQEIPDREARHAEVAKRYLDRSEDERKECVVLTGTNADRRAINDQIRDGLGLKGQGRSVEVLTETDLSTVEKRRAANYRPGQVVEFHKAYSGLGVERGERYEVAGIDTRSGNVNLIDAKGRALGFLPNTLKDGKGWTVLEKETVEFAAGDQIRFRANQRQADGTYAWNNNDRGRVIDASEGKLRILNESKGREVEVDTTSAARLTHHYAATGHSAQGMTVDRAILDFDSASRTTTRESIYTNVTRARYEVEVVTDDRERLLAGSEQRIEKDNALDLRPARERGAENGPDLAQAEPASEQEAERDVADESEAGPDSATARNDERAFAAELRAAVASGEADIRNRGFYADVPSHGPEHDAYYELDP